MGTLETVDTKVFCCNPIPSVCYGARKATVAQRVVLSREAKQLDSHYNSQFSPFPFSQLMLFQ